MGKDAIFGQSDADAAEDEAIRVAYEKKIQKLTDDAMAEAKKRRDHQRQIATDRLNDARETERKLDSEIKSAVQELSTTEYKLAEAKGNLAKTQAELERLGSKETELVCWSLQRPREIMY